MSSIATKRFILAAFFMIASTMATAGDKPPRYVIEPATGLRLDAGAKLEALPSEVSALCSRDTENWILREWIFAGAQDAASSY